MLLAQASTKYLVERDFIRLPQTERGSPTVECTYLVLSMLLVVLGPKNTLQAELLKQKMSGNLLCAVTKATAASFNIARPFPGALLYVTSFI